MIISHKYKFIFIKTRKTAGTSIEVYLNNYRGDNDIFTPISFRDLSSDDHTPMNYDGFENHTSANEVKKEIPNHIWNSYFKFAIERNPWDKVISHYYSQVNTNPNFSHFMEKGNDNKNYKKTLNYPLYTDGDQIILDYIGYYENLNKELNYIFSRLGIPFDGELKVKAKTTRRKDRRHYSEFFKDGLDKYISVIRRTFWKEIELHGYTF